MRELLSASQAAETLGVDKRTVLRFAKDGKLRSYRTPGGQHRFRRADVERLAAGDGNASRGSLPAIQDKRDEIEALNLEVRKRRIKRELSREEAEDAEAARQQLEAQRQVEQENARAENERKEIEQRERAERRERSAIERRERQRRAWENEWIAAAIGTLPGDVPFDVKARVQRRVREALGGYNPLDPPVAIEPIVCAAQNDALQPWHQSKEIEKAVLDALWSLPFGARQFRFDLTDPPLNEWEVRAVREARVATRSLLSDSSVSEIRAAATEGVKKVAREYEQEQAHKQQQVSIQSLVVWLDAEEKIAVLQALERLPVGCDRREMERAKDAALAPIRERAKAAQEARNKEQAAQGKALIDKIKAESRADRLLGYVGEYIEQIGADDGKYNFGDFSERYRLAEEIKKQLRPEIIQLLLEGELSEGEARELIEEAVDREA